MRQGPSFETSTPVEADFEIVPDIKELSAEEVGQEVQKLLAEKKKIKAVNNFKLEGVGNQMNLEADIEADIVGSFGLKASIKSDGTSIRIGDIDVVAGALKKMAIKKFINGELPGLVPKIKDYLSTKYGKPITGLSIEDGKLKVCFPDKQEKVQKKVPVATLATEPQEAIPPVVETSLPQPAPDEVEASEALDATPEPVEPSLDVPVTVETEPPQTIPLVEKPLGAPKALRPEEAFFENFFNKRNRDPKEFEEWFRATKKNIDVEPDSKEKNKHLKRLESIKKVVDNLPETSATSAEDRKKVERDLRYLSDKNMIVIPDVEGDVSDAQTSNEGAPEGPQPDIENGVTTPLPTGAAAAETPDVAGAILIQPGNESAQEKFDAVDNESIQKAEQAIEAIPDKQRRQFYRGFLGLGYTVRGLKSEALSRIAGKFEKEANAAAVDETKAFTGVYEDTEEAREERRGKVIFQQDSFLARLVRGSATKYRHDADEALRNLDKIYAEGEKSQAVKGVMSSVQFAALVGQVAFRGASKTFNPFRTVGASLLALGAGVEIAKEARINSLERIEKGRLTYDEALAEAEQISEELQKEKEPGAEKKFTSNEYQQEYMKRLPKELLERLKASDVSRLGWASQKAYADIKKTLEKIEARIESAPKSKKARLQKFLGKGFQERYLHDVERLLERDGTIDVVAYGLKKVEKYTKAGAALATVEALVGAFFDYDTLTRNFGHAVDTADPAHPETLGLDENGVAAPIKYEWSGMTTDSMHASELNPLIPEGFLSGHGADESSIDTISAHESDAVLPKEEIVFDEAPETAALLKIGKRGPEGSIIDFFKSNEDVAKKFGWDGKGDIKKWAGTKAHALWLEHASKALETDGVKGSLTKLGYTNDLEGYTKMMTRIKSGGIAIDLEHKGVTLSNMDYLEAKAGAPVKLEAIEKIGFEPALFEDIQSAVSVESEVKETLESDVASGADIETSPDVIESESAQGEVDDSQLGKTREPALHEAPAEALDTRGMSVSEAVVARMNHDLTKVFDTTDEAHSEWPQWRDYGARRFSNISFDPESAPEGGHAIDLQNYLKDLEARSGLRPRARIFWFNQTVDEYIRKALRVIEEKSRA